MIVRPFPPYPHKAKRSYLGMCRFQAILHEWYSLVLLYSVCKDRWPRLWKSSSKLPRFQQIGSLNPLLNWRKPRVGNWVFSNTKIYTQSLQPVLVADEGDASLTYYHLEYEYVFVIKLNRVAGFTQIVSLATKKRDICSFTKTLVLGW